MNDEREGSIAGLYGHARRPPVGLLDALRDRGDLWPAEAALRIAVWLCDVAGWPSVTPRELKALASAPEARTLVPRLRHAAAALRSGADSGLLELVAGDEGHCDAGVRAMVRPRQSSVRRPCYRPTSLGRAVAAMQSGRQGGVRRRFRSAAAQTTLDSHAAG